MRLSSEEVTSGKLNPETLASAVAQVKLNGYVVFEEVLPANLVNEMNAEFLRVLDDSLKNNPDKAELNLTDARKNRIRLDLPFRKPFIDPQVITNSFAMPIIEQILGDDCRCFYLAVDAPLPGSDYQTVHGDYFPFFPEADVTLPATALVVNFPLIDVTEENGPMEAWPGTHLTTEHAFDRHIHIEAAKHIQPVRMIMPKGSMIIRDTRMWHRGTPNRSTEIRPNVALIYSRKWWNGMFYNKSLEITNECYEGLPSRAQQLFRFEPRVHKSDARLQRED